MTENNTPPILNYATPLTRLHMEISPRKMAILGPVCGAAIGIADIVIATLWWITFGKPYFFIFGYAGAEFHLIVYTIGGCVAGLLFASFLALFERLAGRTIPARRQIIAMAGISFLIFGVFHYLTFRYSHFFPFLLPEATVLGLSCLAAMLLSKAPTEERICDHRDKVVHLVESGA